jgi:hypothetical protein
MDAVRELGGKSEAEQPAKSRRDAERSLTPLDRAAVEIN